MEDFTLEDLKELAPHGKESILKGVVDNQHILTKYDILPGIRRQMFLAQIAHESDGFKTTREYASGARYEGRKDLGNTVTGDGRRFRGRGLIQLTGRANYDFFGDVVGVDIISHPELVEQFPLALEVSAAFWEHRHLNAYADQEDFEKVTRRINGGLNGYSSRLQYLEIAQDLDF